MTATKKIIHIDMTSAGNLCCDNTECNYVLPEPVVFSRDIIGMPCPACGDSLMTEQDFEATSKLIELADAVNLAFGDAFGAPEPSEKSRAIGIRIHNDAATVTFKD